jgi:monothiol glutaredoxin
MSNDEQTRQSIESILTTHPVVLFMKGTRGQPQCGFSAKAVQILDTVLGDYATVNVLDDPCLREGIKAYGQWPTIPQLYVHGELIGGCDIVADLFQSGELYTALGLEPPTVTSPQITFSNAAVTLMKQALSQEPNAVLHLRIDARWELSLSLGPVSAQLIQVDASGIAVFMDPSTAARADGLRIDVVDRLEGQRLSFEIPKAEGQPLGN